MLKKGGMLSIEPIDISELRLRKTTQKESNHYENNK